jgi:hypothetical protein
MALTRNWALACRNAKYADSTVQLRCATWAQRLQLRLWECQLDDVGKHSESPTARTPRQRAARRGCRIRMAGALLSSSRTATLSWWTFLLQSCVRSNAAADSLSAMRGRRGRQCGAALGVFFGALSHSGVLCCTPDKLGVMRVSPCRAIAPGTALTVITLAPSLADSERRIALASGPTFVDSPNDYAALLAQSGWRLRGERT